MVAWLVDNKVGKKTLSQVFLDSWKVDPTDGLPRCQLFRLKPRRFGGYQRDPLSSLFDIPGGSAKSVVANLKPLLYPHLASDPTLEVLRVEDLVSEIPPGTALTDISPCPGRLVIFDSVMLPHQVEVTREGQRLALAGWFHERAPPIPQEFRV